MQYQYNIQSQSQEDSFSNEQTQALHLLEQASVASQLYKHLPEIETEATEQHTVNPNMEDSDQVKLQYQRLRQLIPQHSNATSDDEVLEKTIQHIRNLNDRIAAIDYDANQQDH